MLKAIRNLAVTGLLALAFALPAQASKLVIGGKNFTEQQLLTEITAQYLSKLGYQVERRAGMGSTVLRKAQENGQIDLYWEYTGTSLLIYNKVKKKVAPGNVYKTVKALDAKKGLVWLKPSTANDTYALAMRKGEAEKLGISTLSDLARVINSGKHLVLACNAEFYARKDGLKPMEKAYGFRFPIQDIKRMDSGLTYTALKDKQVDVALVFATDGRIKAFHFRVLADDKHFFPEYVLAPVVRKDVLEKNPKLAGQLDKLSTKITGKLMTEMNAQVDVDHKAVEKVAANFLKEEGL